MPRTLTLAYSCAKSSCCCCPVHKSSIEPHIASPGKKWKFKVRFLLNVYCFGTVVKSKKRKLTPPKSGIVCTIKVLGGVECDDIKPDQFVGTSGFCT